jgi:hypothetical protein
MTAEGAQQQLLLAERLRTLEVYPPTRFAGRGIVICAGGASYFTNAYVLVHVLRNALGCRLPIEVWHLGPAEMSPRMQSMLHSLDVRTVDATDERVGDRSHIVDGWQLKAFALMWSRFEEVLLLDADQMPTRDPTEVFEWREYQETGAVLWPDTVDLPPENPIWEICGLSPRTTAAIESGQLLVHKARHWPALQIALHLNEHADFYYRLIYGDKETYLIGLLVTASRFALIPHRPATDLAFCLYQRDFEGNILFQHRTGAKWRYAGKQEDLPGFVGSDACSEALSDLRRGWNGLVFVAPARSPRALRAERDLVSLGALAFVVPGQPPLKLELMPDGEIGEGRSPARMNWHCDEESGAIHLVIRDAFGPCWRLALQPNRRWYGYSAADPTVEAYATVDVDIVGWLAGSSAARGEWPMPGYSSMDDGEL